MEVHHHPHPEKKSFKEYFLEFIMIFLAVTLGFFAEQIRERFVERNKEQEYAKSFYNDFMSDESNLQQLLSWIREDVTVADSLPRLLKKADLKTRANEIYVEFRFLIRQLSVKNFVADRTISQLKNTGEMRLMRNKMITDSILKYYKNVEVVAALQEVSFIQKGKLRTLFSPLLKSDDWDKVIVKNSDNIANPTDNLYLKSINPDVINDCLLEISDIKGIHNGFISEVIGLENEVTELRKLFVQHYKIAEYVN